MAFTLKILGIGLVLLTGSACSSVGYYMQAINGHLDLMSREKPIKELLEQEAITTELKRRLSLSLAAREFASKEMLLPDNDSYKNYADLERPYVVWTVVATPPYSTKPKEWCFYIVGCLSYRGYFSKDEADQLAEELKQDGMDVSVGGTLAYSTLGYFDDPLVNTMMRYDDASLIGIIFHELAHQKVHVDHDTAYNEAFATAVEQEGLRRWYQQKGTPGQYEKYIQHKQRRHTFYTMLKNVRNKLNDAFTHSKTDQEKETAKKTIYKDFKREYKIWSEQIDYRGFDNWVDRDLNNSHLAMIATYQDLVPTFSQMLASVDGDLDSFYELVFEVGNKDKLERNKLLLAYNTSTQ